MVTPRWLLSVGLALLLAAVSATAQTFNLTVPVTAAERATIQARVARLNAATPPPATPWTPQTLTQDALSQCLNALVADEQQYGAGDVGARFLRSTPAQRAAAIAALAP